MIAAVDEFVLYDDMQYTRRDWRNRNQIKTPQGLQWLTVPVRVKGRYLQKIADTEIDGDAWAADHWKALAQNYKRAAHFDEVSDWLRPHFEPGRHALLSDLNRAMLAAVCRYLGIGTRISRSSDYVLAEGRSERLAGICVQAGATEYVSGPAARDYMDRSAFDRCGIAVHWFDYAGYPAYPQLWGEFVHNVSVLDLLFNCGRDAPRYLRHVCGA
jgi:hypothetical protein